MANETDSFLREIDEDLRRERYQKLWDRYGVHVLAGALLIIVGVGGYQIWDWWSAKQAAQSGEKFIAAIELTHAKKMDEAAKIMSEFVEDGPRGYGVLSQFSLAIQTAKSGQTAAAVQAYDKIAEDRGVSEVMQGYARIRGAMLLLGTVSWTEIENRLNDLTKSDNPWRGSAREIIGLAAFKAGKLDVAREQFFALIGRDGTTPGLVKRAEMILGLILAGEQVAKPETVPVKESGADTTSSGPSN